jgi:hypothetical protein
LNSGRLTSTCLRTAFSALMPRIRATAPSRRTAATRGIGAPKKALLSSYELAQKSCASSIQCCQRRRHPDELSGRSQSQTVRQVRPGRVWPWLGQVGVWTLGCVRGGRGKNVLQPGTDAGSVGVARCNLAIRDELKPIFRESSARRDLPGARRPARHHCRGWAIYVGARKGGCTRPAH